jgi:hypothetical protein
MQEPVANHTAAERETEVICLKLELIRRFAGVGGSMLRGSNIAALFPSAPPSLVEEALRRLGEEGVVESRCLADGALAYHFPRR